MHLKRYLIALPLSLAFYLATYAALRGSHQLVRVPSKWGNFLSGENWAETVFQPAWILERKSRSLYWRFQNQRPLYGPVYREGETSG